MCGIAGVYAFTEIGRKYIVRLPAAAQTLSLRGPDAEGFSYDGKAALAHRRLSIMDTSEAANQPMMDHTDRFAIIFNGEIFNYKELFASKLEAKGIILNTASDTEVLLQLYIHYGKECLHWLKGFFAFAVYDKKTDELFIARDHMGKKPLLISRDKDRLLFASEMKAMMALGVDKELDYTSLYQYFQLNYIPGSASIFKEVEKLLPGHYLYIKGNKVSIGRYYQIETDNKKEEQYSYEGAKKRLVELMDKAVRRRLIADVPLGAFLSGGIDSSVVVALAARHLGQMNTFSIGYKDEPFFDETGYAKLVADKYRTHHTVFSLTNNDFLAYIYEVLDYLDEPFADSSCIPMYILCKQTKKVATVALSGDGGDELFAGYNKHMAEYKVRQNDFKVRLVRYNKWIWKMLPKSRSNPIGNFIRQLDRFAEGSSLSVQDRYYRWSQFNTEGNVMVSFTPAIQQQINRSIYEERKRMLTKDIKSAVAFNELLLADVNGLLPGNMLFKVDMMSMANSLEVRCPFLDTDVVNFAFSLPSDFKINGSIKKRIVQDAFRHMLPEELYNRPKKGFDLPLLGWFRKELSGLIFDDLLSESYIMEQGIFDFKNIRRMKQQLFSSNGGDITEQLWAMIVFQYWYRKNTIT